MTIAQRAKRNEIKPVSAGNDEVRGAVLPLGQSLPWVLAVSATAVYAPVFWLKTIRYAVSFISPHRLPENHRLASLSCYQIKKYKNSLKIFV